MSARLTSGFVSFLSAALLALSATTHAMLAPMPAIDPGLPAMESPAISADLPALETFSDHDAFIFADESGRFWLAVQVSPETHNRAIFYVQSPLGLAVSEVARQYGTISFPTALKPYSGPDNNKVVGVKFHTEVVVLYDDEANTYSVKIALERPMEGIERRLAGNLEFPEYTLKSWVDACTLKGRNTCPGRSYVGAIPYGNLLRVFNPNAGTTIPRSSTHYGRIYLAGSVISGGGSLDMADAVEEGGILYSTRWTGEAIKTGADATTANVGVNLVRSPSITYAPKETPGSIDGSISFSLPYGDAVFYSGGQAAGPISVTWKKGETKPVIDITGMAQMPLPMAWFASEHSTVEVGTRLLGWGWYGKTLQKLYTTWRTGDPKARLTLPLLQEWQNTLKDSNK